MEWKQISAYCLLSEDARYSVAKLGSESGRFTYCAWRTRKHELGRLMLDCGLPDAATGKARCEADEQQRQGGAKE
jgi:hypothetical protein